MSIVLKDLCKSYGDQAIVDHLTLEVKTGELFVLLGESGSGKTSILRMIAGLVMPDEGVILLEGEAVTDVPPQQRNIGFVFQNYSLFRHMTVAENIAFGLKIRQVPRKVREAHVERLLEMIGLVGLGDRYPSRISGGQQQRIALARALAYQPKVLLLDEPFGALDLKSRVQLRENLKNVQRQLKITTVLVTHDQGDAFELGDRIGILERGRLLSLGSPSEVYRRPRTRYVAQFLGEVNLLEGIVKDDTVQVGEVSLALREETVPHETGARVQVLIRPEQLEVATVPELLRGTFLAKGDVQSLLFAGASYRVGIRVRGLAGSVTGPAGRTESSVLFAQIGLGTDQAAALAPPREVAVGVSAFHILPYPALRILVAVDRSKEAKDALQLAVTLSKTTQGHLTLLGVADHYLDEIRTKQGLIQAKKALAEESQEAETLYRRGRPTEEILKETNKSRYDLVLFGTRWRPSPRRLLNAPAFEVALNSPIPTLITPVPAGRLQKVLVLSSGEEICRSEMRFIGRLSRALEADVTLLYVQPGPDPRESVLDYLQELLQVLRNQGTRAEFHVRSGQQIPTLLNELREQNYDLLVFSARRMKRQKTFPDRSSADRFFSHLNRPVLVLNAGECPESEEPASIR